jgi:hypothetical protein
MKVEVELEDLETILFSTSAIKNIEAALQARKQDPFVKPKLEYTEAHNKLVEAMNHVRRAAAGTATNWDGKLTKDEIKFLDTLSGNGVMFEVTGRERLEQPEIDTLAAKGCVRIGQEVAGAVWSGQDRPDLKPLDSYTIIITDRGSKKLQDIQNDARV